MGDGLDYALASATLAVCFARPRRGVMTEIEEDLYELEFGADGGRTVTRDDGDSTASVDFSRLPPGAEARMIDRVPAYELHHAVDLPKRAGEGRPPVALQALAARCARDAGCEVGGWFIFEKADRWAFRSNEFSNAGYAACRGRLEAQATAVRGAVTALLREAAGGAEEEERAFTSAASLEKVHCIWQC